MQHSKTFVPYVQVLKRYFLIAYALLIALGACLDFFATRLKSEQVYGFLSMLFMLFIFVPAGVAWHIEHARLASYLRRVHRENTTLSYIFGSRGLHWLHAISARYDDPLLHQMNDHARQVERVGFMAIFAPFALAALAMFVSCFV